MFSSTHPPGASVAWPPRDERQGWAYAAHPRGRHGRPVLGRTSLTKTTEIGTVIRPRQSVTLPARADGSPRAQRLGVRPRVPFPPDPAPSAHPGVPATNLRRGGAGQTARAHGPGVPDRPRRTCGGVPAGSAQMPGATSQGFRGPTRGASHRRRPESHRWRRNHHRDQRRAAATTGTRGVPVDADRLWPDVPRHAITSRHLTRDNCCYRESNCQLGVSTRQSGVASDYAR